MKKLLLFIPFLLLAGCDNQTQFVEQENIQEEPQLTTESKIVEKTIVRNVNRWMSPDEVINAEKLPKDTEVIETAENISMIESDATVLGIPVYVAYLFYKWELFRIMYWKDNATYWDYSNFRKAISTKYENDNWDEICDTDKHSDEMNKIMENEELTAQEKKDKIESLRDILKKCLLQNDIQILNTLADINSIDDMRDTYLSLGYITYVYQYEQENLAINIMLGDGIVWYGVGLIVLYENPLVVSELEASMGNNDI